MRAFLFAAIFAPGCDVFDERLYLEADAGTPAQDSGPEDAGPSVFLADVCNDADVPVLLSFNDFLDTDTTSLENDYFELATCLGRNAAGNDGFFAIDMIAGQKWHFHVKVTPGSSADPAVYVLGQSCDPRECQPGDGLNECIAGQDEHFSFVPDRTDRFLIGVDTIGNGGEALQVLAVRPVCGDGTKEHSESCDDSNTDMGDGCDGSCRAEIPNAGATDPNAEVEPNDEPFVNANIVDVSAGAVRVTGQLGSKCDFDSFGIVVPAGGSVRATLTTPSGEACPAGSPDLRLTLRDPGGFTEVGRVDGGCPAIDGDAFAQGLPSGVYFVRATTVTVNEPDVFAYGLTLEALP
jgi:cysteine-rich repeat protein